MRIGEWAIVFCKIPAKNEQLEYAWAMGRISAIRSDGQAEVINPIPYRPDGMLDVLNPISPPGPYVCKDVIQIGDWVRGTCSMDAQNGKLKGLWIQGVLCTFRPSGGVEVMSTKSPTPYICNNVLPCPDMPGPRAFVEEWRRRLGVS